MLRTDCSFKQKSPERAHAAAALSLQKNTEPTQGNDKMWIISCPGETKAATHNVYVHTHPFNSTQ